MKQTICAFFIAVLLLIGSTMTADQTLSIGPYRPIDGVVSKTGAAADSPAEYQEPAVNLLLQPLGFIQFGPIVELEFRLVPHLYLGVHARFHGVGLLSHIIATEYTELWGIAGGVGARYFFPVENTPHALFVGGTVELGINGYYDNIGYADAYHGTSVFMVAAANSGFRWRFASFIIEAGVYAGAGPTISSQYSYDSNPSVMFDGMAPVTFFFMGELSLGFAF